MIALLGTNDRNGCLLFRGTTLLSALLYREQRMPWDDWLRRHGTVTPEDSFEHKAGLGFLSAFFFPNFVVGGPLPCGVLSSG